MTLYECCGLYGGEIMIVNLIGVPVFWGSDKKGVDLGPNDLRDHDIESIIENHHHTVYDLGNIYIKDH